MVFNSAGGFVPKLAGVCLQCINNFDLPCALNLYLTNVGQKVSAPPHTDKQDVFVLQTQGQKHWRVFAPPPPNRMPRADPLARGKGTDNLSLNELEKPLVDVTLSPGNILYIPAGYPHTTDTVNGITMNSDPSVHLTVGIDTHIWDLNYAGLRKNIFKKLNINDKTNIMSLNSDVFWDLQSCLPLGFLIGFQSDKVTILTEIHKEIQNKIKALEPDILSSVGTDTIVTMCVEKVIDHHRTMTDTFGQMYADVCMKISPAQFDLSYFRSKVL